MAVMAPVSGLSLAALARFSAGLPLPEAAAPPDKQARMPDVVVFSSAPMRVLSDLASAGLRQLAALLPMIEQAVQGESPAPLGLLAKAASAAARQIGDGHEALLAEGPDRVAASIAATTSHAVCRPSDWRGRHQAGAAHPRAADRRGSGGLARRRSRSRRCLHAATGPHAVCRANNCGRRHQAVTSHARTSDQRCPTGLARRKSKSRRRLDAATTTYGDCLPSDRGR